jgi:hypothetical protein
MTSVRFASLLIVFSFSATAWGAEARPEGVPQDYKLVYRQNFDAADSLEDFQFSDPNAWRWTDEGKSGGALELYGRSKYATKYRSPFNLGMIAGKRLGDFVLDADLRQTGKEYGHRDMCLFFGFTSPTQYYYTHIATKPDPHAHNIFIVNNAARKAIAPVPKQGVDWGADWQRVRVQRVGDKIRVFYQDLSRPVFETTNDAFPQGYVGFGSFDDTGKIDNIRIWAPNVDERPSKLFSRAEPKK